MNELAPSHQKRIHKRTIILAFFFFLWFFGLTLRLIQLQVIEHSRLRYAVVKQNQHKRDIVPKRGTIYDRHGNILARSLPVPSVFFIPDDKETVSEQFLRVQQLQRLLDLSDKDLQKIKSAIEEQDPFIYIKRKILQEQAEQIARLNLRGVHFQEENKRFYPQRTLAAHLLGGLTMDGQGASGAELQYDAWLAGVNGKSLILLDANQRRYDWQVLKEPTPGKDLVLTIDQDIQYIVERLLENAVRENKAAWGTVIVSNPASGEILAMASVPTYDPNDYPPSPLEIGRNRAIQINFEPGSTFKIITAAAAVENGVVNFNDIFDCSEGKIRVARWTISDHKRLGILSFPEVIIHSSNVGTIKVSQRIGAENLYRMIQAFHFGEKTGVDLPGEENGIFHPLHKWSGTSLSAHAIGYEISVTALQILQAMNVIANRGVLIPFRITREALNPAEFAAAVPAAGPRVISEETAEVLANRIFEKVVVEGTGQAAQVDGFNVAGKTGTAQEKDPDLRGYSASRHIASFVGFVPVNQPALSIIVVIDDPKSGLYYGGQVAAPVFREIAQRVLLYLQQMPEYDPAQKKIVAQTRSQD
jgi:cell division protein FtsI (penicillin-binding protein 3)